MNNKIIPFLWFSTDRGKISELIKYYEAIFGGNMEKGDIVSIGETPSGHTETCEVKIFGYQYSLMNTEKEHHAMNDAISFVINCVDQKEIDMYWDHFTKEGKEAQCGWCMDKYGLRWQIIPVNFSKLMSKPNSWQVLMKQKKIVIEEYQRE